MRDATRSLLLLASLAGCLGASADDERASPVEEPVTITDRNDYSYLDGDNPDLRPHVHDYWQGKDNLTLYDGSFHLEVGVLDEVASSGKERKRLELGDGKTVIPGTAWINVSITWTSRDSAPKSLSFFWTSADRRSGFQTDVPSGVTISLPTNESSNDVAHAKLSRWDFQFWMGSPMREVAVRPPSSMDIEVGVEIFKRPGPLPFQPAHPDWYGNATFLTNYRRCGTLWHVFGQSYPEYPLNETAPPSSVHGDLLTPIPFETDRVVVRLNYNASSVAGLYYAPTLTWYSAGSHSPAGQRLPPTSEKEAPENGFFEWVLHVTPEMWDSPYLNSSNWYFGLDWDGNPGDAYRTSVMYDGDYNFFINSFRSAKDRA